MELILEDILALCAGKQEDGTAMAGSSISVFGVAFNKTPLIKQEITFTQSLEIHAAGGCITVSIDFKKGPEFYRTAKICMDWLKNPKGTLIYTMIPMVLEGKISVLLQNLVYCDFYEKKNGVVRLILAFDNKEPRLFGSDNIDYENIKSLVDSEFKQKQQDLDDDLERYLEEKAKYENELFKINALGDMDILDIDKTEEENPHNRPGVKFGDEEEDGEGYE